MVAREEARRKKRGKDKGIKSILTVMNTKYCMSKMLNHYDVHPKLTEH